ncbi:acetyl-CoA carboxylase, biotin carboxylase [Candidatus Endolissoclinum faulkneri L2]|uniref:Biotin carboxylase n=2 Tax=Candidatus Endolissoclinum faulkneri TaxID=1263979 RepID=K7Z5M1_9PROT|nr:acetyl-CoA carboxylase, biotin carboxylase [Candidatus Endolissoclinum faulkneri L2]
MIANRGEIALRIHRACREMSIKTVAIHSTADANAMHVRLADESVCIGPASAIDSYLNIPAILSAAAITNVDAIHPGVGFLSENAAFAEIVEAHGITFIGPRSKHIHFMGNKITAKKMMIKLGIPCVPGSEKPVDDIRAAKDEANRIGYPVVIKAANGGGGRGMKVANSPNNIEEAYTTARRESAAAFGNEAVYIERYLENPRHIEIQIAADNHNNVIHLGERDCSIQRRHQKIIEEAPSLVLTPAVRDNIGNRIVAAMRNMGYCSLGTMEFLYEKDEFYFIEMNTRLQVEHPITEAITGIDLVRLQIEIAANKSLGIAQQDITFNGHAIECRINAEDPCTFQPNPGKINDYHQPGGLGVRVDSALYAGYSVPSHYDSLIAKVIIHGANRQECLMRAERALGEYVISGISTTIPLHANLLLDPIFRSGEYSIRWLERDYLSKS